MEETRCYDMDTVFFRQSVPININNTNNNKIFVIVFNAEEFFLILLWNVSSVGFYPSLPGHSCLFQNKYS